MFGLSLITTQRLRDLEAGIVRENAAAHIARAAAVAEHEKATAEHEMRESADALLRTVMRFALGLPADPLSSDTRERVERIKAHYRAERALSEDQARAFADATADTSTE